MSEYHDKRVQRGEEGAMVLSQAFWVAAVACAVFWWLLLEAVK